MATPQHRMKEFLRAILRREQSIYESISFKDTNICLHRGRYRTEGQFELDLAEYPCDVRKEFIQKVKLLDIASLPIRSICVEDEDYEKELRKGKELPDGRLAAIYEDMAEVILAFQSSPTPECTNVVGDGEPLKGRAAMCTLMEATGSTSHHTQPNDSTTLKEVVCIGQVAPQKLKAACSLISAPGSSVEIVRATVCGRIKHTSCTSLAGRFLEEMLSAQNGGSYQALKTLFFDVCLSWDDTSVKQLGEFLRRTPSIKNIYFTENFKMVGLKECEFWQRFAEALCYTHVETLWFGLLSPQLQEVVVRVLMPDSQGHQPITALQHLHLNLQHFFSHRDECQMGVTLCGEVIRMVECLKSLGIYILNLDLKLIEALKSNHGLEHFTCHILHIEEAHENVLFSTIMDVLRVNYQLKEFVYPWENKYYEEALAKLFEERATN